MILWIEKRKSFGLVKRKIRTEKSHTRKGHRAWSSNFQSLEGKGEGRENLRPKESLKQGLTALKVHHGGLLHEGLASRERKGEKRKSPFKKNGAGSYQMSAPHPYVGKSSVKKIGSGSAS